MLFGKSNKPKCISMYKVVLKSMLFRRRVGFFCREIPTIPVNIAKDRKGIKRSLPASVYANPNLETIYSFRLSLKDPKEA